MLGEFFAEILGEFVKDFVLFPLAYAAGKPLVRLFSLGALHTTTDEPHVGKKKKKHPPRPQGLTFVRNGRRYLDYRMTALVGLLGWGAAIAAIVVAARGAD
jgi:hypothetical protein